MKSSLSATRFARIIRRDPKTVINWIKRGYIPGAKRVGNTYHVPSREVDVFQSETAYPPKKWQK